MNVAALVVRCDSVYKALPGVDAFDAARDALTWQGGCSVVAHPPCRSWSRLRGMAKFPDSEPELARWAVDMVRRWGGVLEHPSGSTLWVDRGLPHPGRFARDAHGGFSFALSQKWWGHRAEKATWRYVVGLHGPSEFPDMPYDLADASHAVSSRVRPEISKIEREATPVAFAKWLVQLAASCRVVS